MIWGSNLKSFRAVGFWSSVTEWSPLVELENSHNACIPPRIILLRQFFFADRKYGFNSLVIFFYVLILAPSSIFQAEYYSQKIYTVAIIPPTQATYVTENGIFDICLDMI